MEEPLLSVRNLRIQFAVDGAVVRAVDGLSYDLRRGETLAVVGESGSGKTAHALSLLSLLPGPPACDVRGEVLFHGRDLLRAPPEELRRVRGGRIAMVFQDAATALNPASCSPETRPAGATRPPAAASTRAAGILPFKENASVAAMP